MIIIVELPLISFGDWGFGKYFIFNRSQWCTESIERFHTNDSISADHKNKLPKHKKEFFDISTPGKETLTENRLTSSQCMARFSNHLPKFTDTAIDVHLDYFRDENTTEADYQKFIKAQNTLELAIVYDGIMALSENEPKETLSGYFTQILYGGDGARDCCTTFLLDKLEAIGHDVITTESEDLLITKCEKVHRVVTTEEFHSIIKILGMTQFDWTIAGQKELIDKRIQQVELSVPFNHNNLKEWNKFVQCIKHLLSYFNVQIDSSKYVATICIHVLPHLFSIATLEGRDARLENFNFLAELLMFCGNFEKSEEKVQQLHNALIMYVPFTSDSNIFKVPKLQFRHIEGLIFAFYKLCKHTLHFLVNDPEKLEEFIFRLQYFARGIKGYTEKLREAISGKTEEELKIDECPLEVVAFKTTENINTLIKGFIQSPPSFKSIIHFSWKTAIDKTNEKIDTSDTRRTPIIPGYDSSQHERGKEEYEDEKEEIYIPLSRKCSSNTSQKYRNRGRFKGQQLRIQTVAIDQKRKDAMADLTQVKLAIIDVQNAVKLIKKQHSVEVRIMSNSPTNIQIALEAISLLLSEEASDWKSFRTAGMRENLINDVVLNFYIENIITMERIPGQRRNTFRYKYGDWFYHKDSSYEPGECGRYRCSFKQKPYKCKAAIMRYSDGEIVLLREHRHPKSTIGIREPAILKMKKKSKNLCLKPADIISRVNILYPKDAEITRPDAARQRIYRERRKHVPQIPKSLEHMAEELKNHPFAEGSYLGHFKSTDGAYGVVFGNETLLSYIAVSEELFIDGTFKCRPIKPNSSQLLIVHINKNDVGVPVLFVLCDRRTEAFYLAFWKYLIELLPDLGSTLQFVMMDYEAALIKATRKSLPNVAIRGCWIHYILAISRMWKHLKLKRTEDTNKILSMAWAIPLLPASKFKSAMDIVLGEMKLKMSNNPSYLLFDNYLRNNWLKKKSMVSVWNSAIRTNNFAEGFNRHAGSIMGSRPPFHIFIVKMKRLINDAIIRYKQLDRGTLVNKKRQELQMVRNSQIIHCVKMLFSGTFKEKAFLENAFCEEYRKSHMDYLTNSLEYDEDNQCGLELPLQFLSDPKDARHRKIAGDRPYWELCLEQRKKRVRDRNPVPLLNENQTCSSIVDRAVSSIGPARISKNKRNPIGINNIEMNSSSIGSEGDEPETFECEVEVHQPEHDYDVSQIQQPVIRLERIPDHYLISQNIATEKLKKNISPREKNSDSCREHTVSRELKKRKHQRLVKKKDSIVTCLSSIIRNESRNRDSTDDHDCIITGSYKLLSLEQSPSANAESISGETAVYSDCSMSSQDSWNDFKDESIPKNSKRLNKNKSQLFIENNNLKSTNNDDQNGNVNAQNLDCMITSAYHLVTSEQFPSANAESVSGETAVHSDCSMSSQDSWNDFRDESIPKNLKSFKKKKTHFSNESKNLNSSKNDNHNENFNAQNLDCFMSTHNSWNDFKDKLITNNQKRSECNESHFNFHYYSSDSTLYEGDLEWTDL